MPSDALDELERARAALAASELRLSLALKGANDGWWDWDLLTNELFYSPRWWSMLGYAPDELPADATLWERLRHPDDASHVELVFGSALRHGPDNYEVEFRLLHKQGHYVPLLSRGHIQRDATGRAVRVSGTNTDLTARKQAEQARREADSSQRVLLEAMADGVFVAQDYRFVFANPALPALLGWTMAEFVGLPFERVVAPEFLALWTERFTQRVSDADEPLRHYELRFLTADGRAALWVELRASRIEYEGRRGVLGIVRDISERKRSEAALQASRQIAQSTLDGLTAHICVLDENGIVLATNQAWRAFGSVHGASAQGTGVGADYLAVCERSFADGVADSGRFATVLRDVLAGRSTRVDLAYPCHTLQGSRWFVARVSRGSGDGPVRVIVAHEDITEQVDVEHRIANLNQRLALAIHGAGYGVWEFVLDTQTLVWDEPMHAIYGHTRDSFDGSAAAWTACVHPEDRDVVAQRFADLMAGTRVDRFQFRILRASDGVLRQIEANGYLQRDSEGRAQRLVGMNRDVTVHAEAERALRDSEERWNFALEGSGDGVWDSDLTTGRVLYSRRWKEMLGHADDEIGDRFDEWRRRVHPDDGPRVDAALQAYCSGRAPGYMLEHRLRCKDGTWKWVLTRGLIVRRDADGRPLRLVGTHSDLSAQKKAEALRDELETRLRETQKMEAIDTLAGGVAHDFNNVLAGILVNVELASQDVGAQHPAQKSLEQIRRGGMLARSLVQKILAFSRRQPQQLKSQPLQPMVEEALALLRSTLPAVVALDSHLAPEPLHVLADATQMQQVLMNLCTNAWHALQGSSGRIQVGLDALDVAPDATGAPGGIVAGRYAHLWVADNGCGMDAEARLRIFEPFYTTKPVGQGTGLGLAVVRGIVSAHGGAITVDSTPGIGSRFHLYLPLSTAPAAGAPSRAPVAAVAGSGQHVLYIDDDEVMVLTVERLLQRAGYRVTSMLDARAAVAEVRAAPESFDLVVTDFNMPEFSGLDVLREIGAIRPTLPVVISSGYISGALRTQARNAGVRALLRKENTVEELGPLVHRVLSGRDA